MAGFVLGPGAGSAYGFHGATVVIKASGQDTAGGLVFVPRDRGHGFTVTGEEPARVLVITGPARLDGQIAARGELPP